MWKDIFAQIDQGLQTEESRRPIILIMGEVSAGKTMVLNEILDERDIPRALRPISSIEAQTSIPLLVQRHDQWSLQLRNFKSETTTTLQQFPNRSVLHRRKDLDPFSYLLLSGPVGDWSSSALEIADLRGSNEVGTWQKEQAYLQRVLESRIIVGIIFVISNDRLQSERVQSYLQASLSLFKRSSLLLSGVRLIPIVTHVALKEEKTNAVGRWKELKDSLDLKNVYVEDPKCIHLHDALDALDREDFRSQLSYDIQECAELKIPIPKPTISLPEFYLESLLRTLLQIQKLSNFWKTPISLPTNKAKLNVFSKSKQTQKLYDLLQRQIQSKSNGVNLTEVVDDSKSLKKIPENPFKKWLHQFLVEDIVEFGEKLEYWQKENEKAMAFVQKNLFRYDTSAKLSRAFHRKQASTDRLEDITQYLSWYTIEFLQDNTVPSSSNMIDLIGQSIVLQELQKQS